MGAKYCALAAPRAGPGSLSNPAFRSDPSIPPIGSNQRHRLRGAAAFARMFRAGRRLDGAHLQLLVAPAAGAVGCVGYVIAKKQLARAVDRNYLRRMVREAVRHRRPGLDAVDIVVRLRKGCEPDRLPRLGIEAAELLDRLTAGRPG